MLVGGGKAKGLGFVTAQAESVQFDETGYRIVNHADFGVFLEEEEVFFLDYLQSFLLFLVCEELLFEILGACIVVFVIPFFLKREHF